MQFRKPTGNEMKWFGAGYGAGAVTFPYVKKGVTKLVGSVVGLFYRGDEEEETEVSELPRSRSTTARKAAGETN